MLSIVATLVLGYAAVPPFEAVIQAHKKLNQASILVTTETLSKGRQAKARYDVEYVRPDTIRLAVHIPDINWTFLLKGTSFLAYDPGNDEFMKKTVIGKSPILQKLTQVAGTLDESVKCVIEPASLREYFAPFRTIKRWTKKGTSAYVYKEPGRSCSIEIDPQTKLLVGAELTGGTDKVVWRFKYLGKPKLERPTIPLTAIRSNAFEEKRVPPTWLDSRAQSVAQASIVAYGNLKMGEFEMSSEKTSHVFMNDGKIRIDQPNVEWRYDGENLLVVFPQTQKAYTGKLPLSEVSDKLLKLGVEVDGFTWYLVLRQNPMRKLLLPASHVRVAGSMMLDGVSCDLLEMESTQIRVNMAIRSDNHLIVSSASTYLDERKNRIGGDERKIRYIQVGQALKEDCFDTKVPPGYTVSKLP